MTTCTLGLRFPRRGCGLCRTADFKHPQNKKVGRFFTETKKTKKIQNQKANSGRAGDAAVGNRSSGAEPNQARRNIGAGNVEKSTSVLEERQ